MNKWLLLIATLLTALLIFINYRYGLDRTISASHHFYTIFSLRALIYAVAFIVPYLISSYIRKQTFFSSPQFCILMLTAPLLFALKASLNFGFIYNPDYRWNLYWHYIISWPLLAGLITFILFMIRRVFHQEQTFYGINSRQKNQTPFWSMLFIMLPLVAAASTQPDFLEVYPKMNVLMSGGDPDFFSLWNKILFEISYGTDFFTIELFFRGFLVLGFIKWAGKDAILPMAVFYCSIHFGKPLGECISSYFGGLILGVIVYHTKSIWGGLIVHLGIAWMMEIFGHFGHQFFQ